MTPTRQLPHTQKSDRRPQLILSLAGNGSKAAEYGKAKTNAVASKARWKTPLLDARSYGSLLSWPIVAIALFARSSYSLWTRQVAVNRLRSGAITDACRTLRRAAWISPKDGSIDMMLAFCFRQLRQPDLWHEAMEAAERKGVPRPDNRTRSTTPSHPNGKMGRRNRIPVGRVRTGKA